jgi:hypothetical protein
MQANHLMVDKCIQFWKSFSKKCMKRRKKKKNHMVAIRWFNCEKEKFPKLILKKKIQLMGAKCFQPS